MSTSNMNSSHQMDILPEPEVIDLTYEEFNGRQYAPIWRRCLAYPGRKIQIRMIVPTDANFKTIRKAIWKIKAEDVKNRGNWRLVCEREGKDKISFWIIPRDIARRI
jgi:hypothetical protein